MTPEFRKIRVRQIQQTLQPFMAAKDVPRPHRGWIRAIREASGITLREMGRRLGKVPSLTLHLEKSEAENRITLGSLRDAAEVLGCELVYALVPRQGSMPNLLEESARSEAEENVCAVEHSMALEGQAVGGVEKKIAEETRRILSKL